MPLVVPGPDGETVAADIAPEPIVGYTACNAVHTVEQRLARWLLLAQDRIGIREFSLTQEFVAMMLGASRPTARRRMPAGLEVRQRITSSRPRWPLW